MLAGLIVALWSQRAVAEGASGERALLGFGAAAGFFLYGLIQATSTGLLAWRGPLARPEEPMTADAPEAPGSAGPSSDGPATPDAAGGRLPAAHEPLPAETVTPGAPDAAAAGGGSGTVAGAGPHVPPAPRRRVRRRRRLSISRPLFLAALACGAITFLASGGNRFTIFNVTTWLLSIALGIAACWERPERPRRQSPGVQPAPSARASLDRWLLRLRLDPSGRLTLSVPWTGVALALILALGVGLLFYRLGDVPRDMTSDHAEKLLDARDVLDGQHRIFFPRNTGREAFQFYLIAAMTPIAGLSYLTMKLGTALVASFTLPFTFLLTRVLFGTHLALLATGILVVTRWHLQVARVGLRFPFPPAFGAATFYFLLKALRDRRRNDFLLCGLVLGIAQHTYTALRLAPLGVLGCIAIALAADVWRHEPPARVRRLVVDSMLLFFIAALVFMPLARYAADEPQSFLFRSVTRIASDAGTGPPPNLAGVFLTNVKNALTMFNWRGDVVWVNNIAGERLLDPISGALFVLGCSYGLYRLLRFRELPFLYLFVLFFVGLLPSILSLAYPQENPSTVRAGMAIPVVVVLVTLPLFLVARQLRRWLGSPAGVLAAGGFLTLVLTGIAVINFVQYFSIYPRQHALASQHTSQVGRVVNGFLAMGGQREDVFILPGAHWIDTRLVAIEAGDIRWNPLITGVEDARRHDGRPRPRLYIVHPNDRHALDTFARWYPGAIQQVHALDETGGRPWFVTVLVPPGATATG